MKKLSLVLALALMMSVFAFTASAESSIRTVDTGWTAMFIDNGSKGTATVSVESVDTSATINNSSGSIGSAVWEGESALKMVMDHTGSSGDFGAYGNLYAYTAPLSLTDGETYVASGYFLSADAGDWTTAFGIGIADETSNTYSAKANHWINGTSMSTSSISGSYWKKFSFEFTYDAATMEGLRFHAYQRSRGYNYANEMSIDNIKVIKKGDATQTNLIANAGFGSDIVEKDPVSRIWDIDTGWNGMYAANAKFTETSAEVVDGNAVVSHSSGSFNAVIEGDSALKMVYKPGVSGSFGTYGHNYAYTDSLALADGKTYTVSGIFLSADAGAWTTAFGMGTFDEVNMKRTSTLGDNWLDGDTMTKTTYSGYWKQFSFDFTYDEATMGDLRFYAYQRCCGYSYANEMSIDNIKIVEKDAAAPENLITNPGFGSDVVSDTVEEKVNTLPERTLPAHFVYSYGNDKSAEADRDVFTVVNDIAYEGSQSLKLNNVGVLDNEQYYLTASLESGLAAGDYTFSFACLGNPNTQLGSNFYIKTASGTFKSWEMKWLYDDSDFTTATKIKNGNEWLVYTYSFTVTEPITQIQFNAHGVPMVYYYDALSLTKDGDTSGTNYIKNGSFEEIKAENTIADPTLPIGYTVGYGGNAAASKNRDVFTVVNDRYASARNSLKIKNVGVLPNEQYYLDPELEADAPTGTYTLSVKLSESPTNNLGSVIFVYNGNTVLHQKDLKWEYQTPESTGTGWYLYKWTIDATTAAPTRVRFNVYENNRIYYMDDLSLTLDGDTTGKNYIKNGGFDEVDKTAPAEVTGVTVVNKNGRAEISWTNPDSGYAARIYNGDTLLTETVFPECFAEVTGLTNGSSYDLTIKTVNNWGYESEGVSVTAEPYLPDYEFSDVAIADGREKFIPGATAFKTTAYNYLLDSLDATLIAALYTKEGALADIGVSETATLAKGEEKELTASVTVPEDFMNYEIRTFLMNNTASIAPLEVPSDFAADPTYAPKNVYSQEELLDIMTSYADIEIDSEGYIDAKRYSAEHFDYLTSVHYGGPALIRNAMLSFTTDAPIFYFEYKLGDTKAGDIDIFVDGELASSTNSADLDATGTFSYELGGGEHRVDIYLPQQGVTIRNFAVTEGYTAEPINGRTKAMFYGDSITQGIGIFKMSDNYASRFSRLMDYEMLNYGVSGYVYDPGQIFDNDYFVPDVIYVAYGVNDAGSTVENFAEYFEGRFTQFMDNLTTLYPTQKIYLITPLWTSWADRQANLPTVRETISTIGVTYDNVTIIDGTTLLPAEEKYFTDGIHPNSTGAGIMAENLVKAVTGE